MGEIIKETEHMRFELVEKKPKTNRYHVVNKKTDDVLGVIEWYNYWRQYIFEPESCCVFNSTCLNEIVEFLGDLNIKHREKKNQGL